MAQDLSLQIGGFRTCVLCAFPGLGLWAEDLKFRVRGLGFTAGVLRYIELGPQDLSGSTSFNLLHVCILETLNPKP